MDISIIISNYKRLEYLKKTLNHIRINAPLEYTWEVVLADEISEESPQIIELLHYFDKYIKWKYIAWDAKEFEKQTGIVKFHNNPAATNNVAILNADGKILFHQGNEVLATNYIYTHMMKEYENLNNLHTIIYSTTYNMKQEHQIHLGEYAENLNDNLINKCKQFPLQSPHYKCEVTNYISLYPKESALTLNLYDERYVAGIACDDSCMSRRFRQLPNAKQVWSKEISIHLDHGGVTCYNDAKPDIIQMSKWNTGVSINRTLFHSWDGVSYVNQQPWPPGIYGVTKIIRNY